VNGFSPDTFGATRVSFSATTTINRNDFGVSFNAPIPGLDHAMLLSDSVAIILDVEAVLQSMAPSAEQVRPHHDRRPPFRSTPRTSGVPAGSGF